MRHPGTGRTSIFFRTCIVSVVKQGERVTTATLLQECFRFGKQSSMPRKIGVFNHEETGLAAG